MKSDSELVDEIDTNPKPRKVHRFYIRGRKVTFSHIKWLCFLMFLVLGLVALVAIIIHTTIFINSFDIRVDCNPDLPLNYENCLKRGCIWVQRPKDDGPEPPCFFPEGYGYRFTDVRKTSNGFHVDLKREPQNTIYGDEVDSVNLIVSYETSKRLRMKFVDSNMKRYEVPLEVPVSDGTVPKEMDYVVEFVNKPQFGVKVERSSTKTVIFDTNVPGMVFSNQFIQISTKLPSSNIYGLGEHLSHEYRKSVEWKNLSFFARDTFPATDANLYGVHPFYMNVENDGNAHGVFLLNSNAMDVILQPYPALTYRTIGGILDFYVFLGPTPEEVVQQYLEVVGMPMMPPYWSLGFHLSKYGYNSLENVEILVNRTLENGIPYDVQYFDIDYMDNNRDFTVDEERFGNLNSFVDYLHRNDVKVIIILDPAISSNKTLKDKYSPLEVGENRNVFVRVNGSNLEGKVWPGKVYFPDFSHPQSHPYWSHMCSEFRRKIEFDGLWIDMNEPANFVDGSLTGCTRNSWNYPPYTAGVLGSKKTGSIFEKTICMDAEQHAGRHYDVHSLYGFFQANVTFRTLSIIIPGMRPMVLSRSTYAGSGRYAAHWLGDNHSSWTELRASIPGILEFNIFGIPMVGADICGFFDDTTDELCLRWMQLGAFYPYSRNHNGMGSKDQDPAIFNENTKNAMREALLTRYQLLPYLYTLFHLAHIEGSTVARPLLHEFPKDSNTWTVNHQFLWGPALLISPIVHEGAKEVKAYIPEGIWYDFYTGGTLKQGRGSFETLYDLGRINLNVRGGHILPLQMPDVTTTKSRELPMGLFIAPDEDGNANGLLFWDDGKSHETQEHKTYLLLEFSYSQTSDTANITSNVKVAGYKDPKANIGYMTICRQSILMPKSIELNGEKMFSAKWEYSNTENMVRLESLNIPISEKFSLVIYH